MHCVGGSIKWFEGRGATNRFRFKLNNRRPSDVQDHFFGLTFSTDDGIYEENGSYIAGNGMEAMDLMSELWGDPHLNAGNNGNYECYLK